MLLPFMAASLAGTLAYGLLIGTLIFSWRFFLLLAIYPLWGLVQQFLVVGLFAADIRKNSRVPEWAIILGTAVLFAAIHLPSIPLVIVTGLMASITTFVYFRAGNIYALGLFHGWVATLSYFFLLGTDPLAEMVRAGIWP